jgi:hypothetical protein
VNPKKTNPPWIVKPIVTLAKKIFRGFNSLIGFSQGKLDAHVYEKLFNSHVQRFGQPDHTKRWFSCKKQLIKLRTQRIITGDNFLLNYIEIEKHKLEELKKVKGLTTGQILAKIATYKGVAVIHKKDISVVEFEDLIKDYVRAASKKE